MRDRRRRPYEILERQSTRIGPIRLDPCVDQQRNRFRRLMLKLTDHQRAATGGGAPVHVAQAVTVAELAHARDLQPRAVRPGNRRGIWSVRPGTLNSSSTAYRGNTVRAPGALTRRRKINNPARPDECASTVCAVKTPRRSATV